MKFFQKTAKSFVGFVLCTMIVLSGCESINSSVIGKPAGTRSASPSINVAPAVIENEYAASPEYIIGPLDQLQVFVWRAPELSSDVTVRPDGRLSTPLVQDLVAAGKTPSQLATDLEGLLGQYVKSPEVTVKVTQFSSTFDQQIRVLGEAQRPEALPYQAGMTVLDVMVAVGGLTEFAAGNKAVLIRQENGEKKTYRLKLGSLMRRADVKANVPVKPGDVILIPESLF